MCIPFGLLRRRQAQGSAHVAILGNQLIQSRQNLEIPNDLGYHSLDLKQSKLLANTVTGTSTEGHILKGSWLLQVKALWSEPVGILEDTIIVTQHQKTQVQGGALWH